MSDNSSQSAALPSKLLCTVWDTAESHRVLFRPDVGCPYCEISHQANEIERLEECIRGMSAHAMKAAAEETRLREALERIARDERAAHQAWVSRSEETAREALRPADETIPAQPADPHYPNVLKEITSEWAHEKNDMCITVHHRMVGGVLCRWWGDGPTPEGVGLIDRAAENGTVAR